ncbi:insulinase family protein [Flavobacteriaceae bacterium AH-315-B10]|nr:insulinase family protein [Flavobacteriaceae bacterium AH-315-B10]
MKTKISILITLFLLSMGVAAQIDRSKQPKPGSAPKITLQVPQEFVLDNGMKVMVVENHKLPRVSYNLNIDNAPITEGDKAGTSSLLGAMLGNGTTNIPKDDFNEEIDFLGASLSFGSQSAFVSALSKYSERILELMADAAINPLLIEEEFQKEKDKLIEGLKNQEKSVDAVAGRVGVALAYGTKHPSGEFVSEETVNNVTLENVNAFYQKYFNPNNAYLVIIGDVDYNTIKKQVETYFGKWEKSIEVTTNVPTANLNVQYTQINFVDMPNAVQSNISLMNTVSFKMNNPDYHSVIIANHILGGGASGYLFNNLREEHGYTYGAYSSINSNEYISRFRAGASVRNMVTDSSVVQILKEVIRIRTEDVKPEDLVNAKAKYVGDFVLALERPQTIARYALNIKINDLPEDFYATYLEKINALTIEDIKRVANTYFKADNARIVVVGKGSEVLANLEKTGIPIKYFDKYANPVEKPEFTKPIPSGVTAQSVIDNYITAIGGKDNAMLVKTVHSSADVTIEGAPFAPKADIKQMVPNKESMEMSIEGMGVIMKQKFNGETGYIEQQGRKMPMEGEVLDNQKSKITLFPELYYDDSYKISLESLTTINGNDVYKVKIEKDGKTSFKYYNAETGLLVREESTVTIGENETTSVVDYSKYSPVKGVQFPYHQIIKSGPQTIIFNVTNVLVNEGVSDEDFN